MTNRQSNQKSQTKRIYFVLSVLLLALILTVNINQVHAQTGITVGSDQLILNSGENLYYGVMGETSNAGASGLLLQRPAGNNIFRVDPFGNVISAGNVGGVGLCMGSDCRTSWSDVVSSSNLWKLSGTHLYASSTDWNVGIGTTNPTSKLTVSHTGSTGVVGTLRFYNQNNDYTGLSIFSNGTGLTLSGHSGGHGYVTAQSALNLTNLATNGSTLWLGNGYRLSLRSNDGSANYFVVSTAGNVGISNTNPNVRLAVNGNTILGGATQISPLGGSGNVLVMADNLGNLYSTSSTAILPDQLWSGTLNGNIWNGSAGAGNVGIGTTNPTQKLHTYGTILGHAGTGYTVGGVANSTQFFSSANQSPGIIGISAGTVSAIPTLGQYGSVGLVGASGESTGGRINIGVFGYGSLGQILSGNASNEVRAGYFLADLKAAVTDFNASLIGVRTKADSTAGEQTGGKVYGLYSEAIGETNNTVYGGYFSAVGGTNNYGVYSAAGNNYFAGNIGINTTNPSARLTVNGNTVLGGATQITPLGGAGNVLVMADNLGNLYSTSSAAILPDQLWSGTLNGNIWNGSAGAGNVGIGTTTPRAKLDIAGGINLTERQFTLSGNVRTFENVAHYYAENSIQTGTVVVTIENSPHMMLDAEIAIQGYQGLTKCHVRGYTLLSYGGWHMPAATCLGSGPVGSYSVRFGKRTSDNARVILIGNTSTNWGGYPHVSVTRVTYGQGPVTNNPGNWSISIVTDESPYDTIIEVDENKGFEATNPIFAGNVYLPGSGIWNSSGNVGIGTTNPGAKFEVQGSMLSYNGSNGNRHYRNVASYFASGVVTGALKIRMPKSWSNTIIEATIKGNDYFGYTGVWEVVIGGYNYSSLQQWINPSVEIRGKAPFSSVRLAHDGTSNVIILGSTSTVWRSPNINVTDLIAGHLGTNNWGSGWEMSFITDETDITNSVTLNPPMFTSNTGIGINTTAPNARLTVNGNTVLGGATQITPLGGAGNVLVMADNTGNLYATSSSALLPPGSSTLPSGISGQTLRHDGTVWTANSNLFNNGTNVGIGTTNPTSRLTVDGDIRLSTNNRHIYIRPFGRIWGNETHNYIEPYNGSDGALDISAGHNGVGIRFFTSSSYQERMRITTSGNVGIGTTNPTSTLDVNGSINIANGQYYKTNTNNILGQDGTIIKVGFLGVNTYFAADSSRNLHVVSNNNEYMTVLNTGNVGIGVVSPVAKLHISSGVGLINEGSTRLNSLGGAGNAIVMTDNTGTLYSTSTSALVGDYLSLSGGTMSGDINMGGNDISNINKLTVNTIDPLYRIKGVNYSSFAAAIVGGVKEEYVGKAQINKPNFKGEYEFVLDFAKQKEGSDLWVWYKTVDFSAENVDALVTNYGNFAQVYYLIEGEKLIFRASEPTTISYRLIGRRHDWRSWPTKALDQKQTAGFVID